MATDYTYLYEEYPEVISADQLYRICHISKRKAKWLLEHGYIPCEDSGKKTRRYKIRMNDVIDYLRTLEAAPDLVATPVGAFNVKRKQLNPVAQICQKEFQRFLYNIWTDEADILRISDVQVLLGYSAGTIRQWILRKELRKMPGQMRSEKDVICKPFKNHHAEQLKLVTDFDWIDFDRLSDVDELISSVLSCEEAADYIDEGRIHAITESVQRRIGHLQELAMTQTPRQLDTTEDDVREEVAADYAPKMEL